MPDSIQDVIADLERQKAAIENALDALRTVAGGNGISSAAGPNLKKRGRPPKRRAGITAEGRARLAAAMRRRWAAKRTAAQAKRGRPKKK